MKFYIRKADLMVGNILVVTNQNKETIFIASRDKDNPLLIQLYNRLNTKIGEIKIKNNFLKIYSIEINEEEKATINAVPVIEMKYVFLSKINWNIIGNLITSDYHALQSGKEVMKVQPTVMNQGQPGLEINVNDMDNGPIGILIAIFLDKYVRIPSMKHEPELNIGLKSKLSYFNFKNRDCKKTDRF
ncbi:hypothetical protein M5C72_04310 [Companilactobacillus allii]|uniref:Uncharacterized protein n=1 Tax=Companilactobacillus allii TaxID=1847728 RepID=A0A1P8Q3E7_9LACO|nr:hypothetical protein [Companilactobacillus allii]APX72368.1 hypothetical protein BTM29_07250 [Companilactobacillus allii]USQ69461.1 hypothetical protein M5C72_04310 [Companilactobacillus allii]